jgi:3-hydroxyisobutyrate dehydrogenase-like beta-hydroxyacid dehydrogenase
MQTQMEDCGPHAYTVAVMGTAIVRRTLARNAAKTGCAVRTWSRALSDAEPLSAEGVAICATAAQAAGDANLVVTMASDAAAIESFAGGDGGILRRTSHACGPRDTVPAPDARSRARRLGG